MSDISDLINSTLDRIEDERAQARANVQAKRQAEATARVEWMSSKHAREQQAKAWLREHFRADQESDTLLDPPCFAVEFSYTRNLEAIVRFRAYGMLSFPIQWEWHDHRYNQEPYWLCIERSTAWYRTQLFPFRVVSDETREV